ncbi:MAG TPA: CcdC protein domain-containing protein [Verrucomicrobiae bacterium]|nr:CcdC protein domain-containing protein [Verrucomicrobiae bacterium]
MDSGGAGMPSLWIRLLPILLIVIVLIVRLSRPQKISVTRMWVTPIILCALAGWAIYATEQFNPAPPWQIAVGLLIGLVAGIPFGILRGMHTDVRPTDRPGVMYLGSSWITALIFIGAFALRYGVRLAIPQHGSLATVAGDGVLAFAIAFIITSYLAIYRKYEGELANPRPSS